MYLVLAWFQCFFLLNPLNVKRKHSGLIILCVTCLSEDFQKLEQQENRRKIDKERRLNC